MNLSIVPHQQKAALVETADISSLTLVHPQGRKLQINLDEVDDSPQLSPIDSLDPTLPEDGDGEGRLQRSYKVPKPRIVRNDFRRFYPNMWVNVFNSIDRELMTRHLSTYYAPSVVVLQADLRYDREVHPQEIPMYQESAQGLDYLGAFWFAGMNAAPDLVCALRHTTLKVRSDGTSAIKCAFVLKGTMVATLDDQKQKDIERIARYQKHKESGRTDIRDITFTEAAMVAVAPPAIVQVPGGKANILNRAKSPSSSDTSASCTETLAFSNIKNESALKSSPARVKAKSSLKRNEKSQTSLSCSSMDSTKDGGPSLFACSVSSGASVTSVESAGTASTAGTHSSKLSRKRSQRTEASSDPEEQFLRPVPRHQPTKFSSQLSADFNSGGDNNQQAPRAPLSKKARSVLDAAAKMRIDWLSVAESALDAGTLQPCQTQGAKLLQYYSQQPVAPPSAAALLAEYANRTATAESKDDKEVVAEERRILEDRQYATATSNDSPNFTTNTSNIIASSTTNSDTSTGNDTTAVAPVGKKIVMTCKIDCVCSLELELNSNSVITGIVVNYFR